MSATPTNRWRRIPATDVSPKVVQLFRVCVCLRMHATRRAAPFCQTAHTHAHAPRSVFRILYCHITNSCLASSRRRGFCVCVRAAIACICPSSSSRVAISTLKSFAGFEFASRVLLLCVVAPAVVSGLGVWMGFSCLLKQEPSTNFSACVRPPYQR